MAGCVVSANVPQAAKIWELSNNEIPGRVLILNQVNFQRFKTRLGSEVDAQKLNETFSSLKFEVELHTDLKRNRIINVVNKYACMSYSGCGCLVICIMTHGQSNGKLMAQDFLYHISEVWAPLKESETLRGIPKIFFIQACRSSEELEYLNSKQIYEIRSCAKTDLSSLSAILLPHDKDFFFGFSTVEGKVSFRFPNTGSFFMQQLCQRITQMHEENTDLLTMMSRVIYDVTQVEAGVLNDTDAPQGETFIFGQTPVFVSFLEQKIYFKRPQAENRVETTEYEIPEDTPGVLFILYDQQHELEMKQLEQCFRDLQFDVVQHFVENVSMFKEKLNNIASTCSSKTASMFLVVLTSLDENTLPTLGNITFEECMKMSTDYRKLLSKPKIFMFIDTQGKNETVQRDGLGAIIPYFNENSDILQFICYNYACYRRLWVLLQVLTVRRDDILNVLTRALQGSLANPLGQMSYIESTLRHKLVLGPAKFIKTNNIEQLEKLEANVQITTENNVSDILLNEVCEECCKVGEYEKMERLITEVYKSDQSCSGFELKAKVYNEVLIKQRQILGDGHIDTLATMHNISTTLDEFGRNKEGLHLEEECLENEGQVLEVDHDSELRIMHNLGYTLGELGRHIHALPLYEECLEKRRRVLGEEHEATLRTMHNLGYTLESLGRYKDALPFYEECFEKRHRVIGEEHEDTLRTMHNLGYTRNKFGRHKDALPLYEECFEKRRRVLGEEHEDTLCTMHNLGYTLGHLGRHKEALPLYEQCIEKRRRLLGEEHKDTLQTVHNLGYTLENLGRYKDALPFYVECLEKRCRVVGEEDEDTLHTMHNLGCTLENLKRYKDALPLYEECLKKRRRVLGEENEYTLRTMHKLGYTLGELGRHKEALPLYEKCLEKRHRVLKEDHEDTLHTMHNLGYTFGELGRHKEAFPLYEQCIEKRRRLLGEEHKDTLQTMHNLGYTLENLGRHKDALPLYEECLEKRRRVLGEEHEDTLLTLNNLGYTLGKLGRHEEALLLYKECLEKKRRVLAAKQKITKVP